MSPGAGAVGGGNGAGGEPAAVTVVPHTHWDREWYDAFQTYRLKLVRLVDDLLDLLERDSAYRHFLLDGQLAVVDDYLEIRPEHEGRLRALAAAGRLSVGPWYVLMDEFLVSGETIVRNLERGIGRGAAFGGVMEVGYLPDMFGHIAQMPQILALAGFDDAVVWRGVPASVDRTAFRWVAPDGSAVRCEYLVAGYGNGATLPEDAKGLLRRLRALIADHADFLRPGDPVLLMNGSDHLRPQPHLGRVVDEANGMQSGLELTVGSLPGYLAAARVATGDGTDGRLPTVRGELRSGARANVLMGVTSNRVDVKQAAARAERVVERLAEPLSALFLPADRWPGRFLEVAWGHLIRNSAHDSICACSADEVVEAVHHRYAEARQIGEGLADQAVEAVARSMEAAGPVVVNPTARPRSGVVELLVPATGSAGTDVQVLTEVIQVPGTITLDSETVRSLVDLIQGDRIADDAYITDITLTEDETGIDVRVTVGPEHRSEVPVDEVKREVLHRMGERPDAEVRILIDQPPVRRLLAVQDEVPGFGWSTFRPAPLAHPVTVERHGNGGLTLANGLVSVGIDPVTGTFSLDGIRGFGRLVDGGDLGDTYNYSPPAHNTVVDEPHTVEVTVVETGPVRASATVAATYRWPERVDPSTQARTGSCDVTVTTTLVVQADELPVRVTTAFTNPSRDHRLRAHFPLPAPARTSRAECAFAVVERGLTAEGRPEEWGLPTFPSRRFVQAGGLTVVHEGLCEYELVDLSTGPAGVTAGELALTLLRATGMLSRLGMAYRPFPAGPMDPLEGSQLLGPVEVRYALATGDVDPYELADDVGVPLRTAASLGGGTRRDRGSELNLTGAVVSSVRRVDGAVEVRVFNPGDAPTTVKLSGRRGWLVDLRHRPLTAFEGSFELRAHGLATARLED